eukprot:CAMPEP_0119033404 /NCGR_PEP_ID=MMETSP1177-20130426/446_1 /TAXON_ID=2985 /ORGANISM="Ochromonas sp, Strain CCMP1899" /LENGTH=78 /DNA_ID=CAMNT_0006990125 /DNA_START=128 /DNA_END=364 /DNA_ORIENTATION=+
MTRSIPTVLYSSNGDPNDEEDYQDRKLSSTMKEKMMREVQESGGDPNFSKGPILGNPILLVSIVVAVLAILSKDSLGL